MTPDQPSLEAGLRELQAAVLDEALLLRLEAAADGSLTQLSHEEILYEAFLRDIPPARIPTDILVEFQAIVREIPFFVNEKIVLFPKANAARKSRPPLPMWGAAAAVALFGAATAFMIPSNKPVANAISQSSAASTTSSKVTAGNFVPATFNRGLSEVSDEGVVWKSKHQPQSVVRVVYKDIITLKDQNGRTFQVEQPRVEYLLVPAKTD